MTYLMQTSYDPKRPLDAPQEDEILVRGLQLSLNEGLGSTLILLHADRYERWSLSIRLFKLFLSTTAGTLEANNGYLR